MTTVVILLSFCVLSCGTYVVWPSRWNVPAHLQVGFALVAYVIPSLLTDTLVSFPRDLVEMLALIMAMGAVSYLAGLVGGAQLPRLRITNLRFAFTRMSDADYSRFVARRVTPLVALAVVGMAGSFAIMGFVPLFARNPLMAKFLRGAYQQSYRTVAIPFRTSYFTIVTLWPILFILWYRTRRLSHLLLLAISWAAIAVTLTRGPMGAGFLLAVGLIAASKGRGTTIGYVLFVLGSYVLGSLALGLLLDNQGLTSLYANGFVNRITSGAPDLPDALNFLGAFLSHPSFTYGRTFIGGLVPYHYRWNPMVWSLQVLTGMDSIENIVSGGLRLPVPLMGYTAFGYPGVITVSFFSGLFMGYGTRFAQRYVRGGSLVRAAVAISLYNTVVSQMSVFYWLQLYNVPAIALTLFMAYPVKLWMRQRPRRPVGSTPMLAQSGVRSPI